MNWTRRRLNELGHLSRGRSRHRPRDAALLYGGPYPFIQTGDVKHAGLYINDYKQTYSEAGLEQSKMWPVGTLCITIAANIADTSILGVDACFPDSVIGFVPDDKRADMRFVKYLFDATIKRRVQQFTQGAAQDNLSQEKLLSIEFSVPDVTVQRKIAEVLSTYDNLIEKNRRRMALLEDAARQLYREWFVHLRFPGHEHVKTVGGAPTGWQRATVSEVVDVNPTVKLDTHKEVFYVPMSSLSEDGMTVDCSLFERRESHTSVKFCNGDVLLARITPCLENGKTAFVYFLNDDEVACGSTEFIVLRGREVSQYFVYCLSRTHDFRGHAIKSMIGSSGRQRVQTSCFDDFFIPIPPKVLGEQFDDLVATGFSQIRVLKRQNDRLRKARDLLLPRLMSGEIEV